MLEPRGDEPEQGSDAAGGELSPKTGPLGARDSERIGLALLGKLPCAVCGYDLRGLSVRSLCPECGTLVRATILLTVDPKAAALAPMRAPRMVGAGIVLWSGAGLVATLLCWLPRAGDLLALVGAPRPALLAEGEWRRQAVIGLTIGMGAGGLAFIRPMRSGRLGCSVCATIGALMFAPIAWALERISERSGAGAWPYFVGVIDEERTVWRLALGAALAAMLLGIRPNARLLVQRSLALRTGRVDRQTILAMVGAVGLAALGDLIRLAGSTMATEFRDPLDLVGTALVGIGSLLFTVGAAGAFFDSIRIAQALFRPAPGLHQVVGRASDYRSN